MSRPVLKPDFVGLEPGRSCSFAPPGLAHFPPGTHGLRRGLHSYAASRLIIGLLFHFSDDQRAMAQTPPMTQTPLGRAKDASPHKQFSGGVVGRIGVLWFGRVGIQLDAAHAGCFLYEFAGGGRTVSGHYGSGRERKAQGICLIVEVENDLA